MTFSNCSRLPDVSNIRFCGQNGHFCVVNWRFVGHKPTPAPSTINKHLSSLKPLILISTFSDEGHHLTNADTGWSLFLLGGLVTSIFRMVGSSSSSSSCCWFFRSMDMMASTTAPSDKKLTTVWASFWRRSSAVPNRPLKPCIDKENEKD